MNQLAYWFGALLGEITRRTFDTLVLSLFVVLAARSLDSVKSIIVYFAGAALALSYAILKKRNYLALLSLPQFFVVLFVDRYENAAIVVFFVGWFVMALGGWILSAFTPEQRAHEGAERQFLATSQPVPYDAPSYSAAPHHAPTHMPPQGASKRRVQVRVLVQLQDPTEYAVGYSLELLDNNQRRVLMVGGESRIDKSLIHEYDKAPIRVGEFVRCHSPRWGIVPAQIIHIAQQAVSVCYADGTREDNVDFTRLIVRRSPG